MENWELIWCDEFDGDRIDKSKWCHELGYIRNNEIQYYTDSPKNSYIENGNLVIEAIKEDCEGFAYTSASLNTEGKFSVTYGKIEMRARLPYGQGIWPAFWTLGVDIPQAGWPACGEIDIMELVGGTGLDAVVHAAVHDPAELKKNARPAGVPNKGSGFTYVLKEGRFADDYHRFSVEWSKDEIKWFVDDTCYHTENIINVPEFHKEHFLLVNLAMGGEWAGLPDETTVMPQKFYIDWIRVYQTQGDNSSGLCV